MKKHEMYLEVLKTINDYVTIKEWANEFAKMYPSEVRDTKENEKVAIRKLVKTISSLISTGKYSNMLLIDKSTKPQKVKYTIDEQKENSVKKNIHLSQSTKGVKSVNFKNLMKEIENSLDYDDLPRRGSYTSYETIGNLPGYKEFIAFQMAIRNKDVIEITKKLDYIKKTIEDSQSLKHYKGWLLGLVCWNNEFKGDPPESSIDLDFQKEFIDTARSPIANFKDDIAFLNIGEKLIDENSKDVLCLKFIADYLQEKLVMDFHIYKDGYYLIKDSDYFDSDEVIDFNSIHKHNFNTYSLEDEMKLSINKFMSRKAEYIKQTADIFFMYDYYSKREADNNLTLCVQDIKSELTKYHGIEIKKINETLTYNDCLKRYDEFKDSEASFYAVEKTITDKIKLMEEFINKKLYKFILFY